MHKETAYRDSLNDVYQRIVHDLDHAWWRAEHWPERAKEKGGVAMNCIITNAGSRKWTGPQPPAVDLASRKRSTVSEFRVFE